MTSTTSTLLGEAFVRHHDRLVSYITDRLDPSASDAAEDLAGQVWLEVASRGSRVDERVLEMRCLQMHANTAVHRHREMSADEPDLLPYSADGAELAETEAGYQQVLDDVELAEVRTARSNVTSLPAPATDAAQPVLAAA